MRIRARTLKKGESATDLSIITGNADLPKRKLLQNPFSYKSMKRGRLPSVEEGGLDGQNYP